MIINSVRSILMVSFLVSLLSGLRPVERVHALSASSASEDVPALISFVNQVKNGQAGELRGLYVPELLAIPVIQQPAGDHEFVSPRNNTVTQFGLASRYGSTGLLAHNYLAGQDFSLLEKNQKLHLVYGDGQVTTFVITEILQYQALEPDSTSSGFVGLEDNTLLTTAELFAQVYHGDGTVVLQTCISRDNDLSWGRLFVIAEPYSPVP